MDIYMPPYVEAVINRLEDSGFEAYIVGGCVRDSLLGKEPKDYDITTSASPEQIKECFSDSTVIETGIKHGTVTVVSDGNNIEVTTFRVDGDYTDHRHPSSVEFSDKLVDDLLRRDFTINSMAYNHRTGIIDKFGAQRDLFRRVISCVGEPAVRFNEDALRIMRALRFSAELGFEIDEITTLAIHDMKRLLKNVSAERIAKELMLLLTGSSPYKTLTEFADVFAVIIPEIKPCIGFDQHSRYHVYDVWEHTAASIEHSKPDPNVRLALLLHDIAKPQCFKLDDEGNGHFFNHEKLSAEMAEQILHDLKMPSAVIERVTKLIKYHYVTPVDDVKVVKRLLSAVGEEDFPLLIEVMKGDNKAKQSFCFERVQTLDTMQVRAREIIEQNQCVKVSDLTVDGNDMLKIGFSGKGVGEILDVLLNEVIEENISNTRSSLLEFAEKYYAENACKA